MNPDYCADASAFGHSCSKAADAGHEKSKTDASPDASSDAKDGGDAMVDVTVDLPAEPKPMCSLASCPGAMPICDVDAGTCHACATNDECKSRSAMTRACDKGQCYECVGNAECTDDATKPICDAHACRKCKADSECGGPGVCLTQQGSCAKDTQVVYVEFNANGCAGADGSTTKPFCTPNEGAAKLDATHTVLIIRGPVNNQLLLDTGSMAVTVVGKKNMAGEAASIPLGVSTGIRISSGNVKIYDLQITGGTGAASKGITIGGATAGVVLVRVVVSTGPGLGIQADTGASLGMNGCIVEGNASGGLLINGASFEIINSVFAMNGYGVKFTAPKTMSFFQSNTIVANTGNAVTCDLNMQAITGSIVAGVNDSCTLVQTVTTAPTFSATRPYHLTAHLPCPPGDAIFPPIDIDGEPRMAPADCGADQFFP
jgi:hypothetical protein